MGDYPYQLLPESLELDDDELPLSYDDEYELLSYEGDGAGQL